MISFTSSLTIAACCILLLSSTLVQANWRGPYDTHDEHSLWLRGQMEKPPQTSFIVKNESDGFNIMDYGAVPTTNSIEVATQNGNAFAAAVAAANSSTIKARFVIVPSGFNFWMIPQKLFINLNNVTFQFNGNLSACNLNMTGWPLYPGLNKKQFRLDFIALKDSTDIVFVGNGGVIQGHGYPWWKLEFEPKTFGFSRPNLIDLDSVTHLVMDSVQLFDSPRYHVHCNPCFGVLIQKMNIEVSIFDQYFLLKKNGKLAHKKFDLPTFPLNTDGIDIRGNTVLCRDSRVLNFDDSLCPKPLSMKSSTGCSRNMLFQNNVQVLGVGNSIGSVPPTPDINCVMNVTFEGTKWIFALKQSYLKPNPYSGKNPNEGGIISDITYKNSYGVGSAWWSIYASTQQQDQPGGHSNTGCSFFYPLPGQKCPTDPRVPINNLILDNITSEDSLLSPGILRCNETTVPGIPYSGPCRGWKWNNVRMTSITKWPFGENFLCHALEKPQFTNVYPSCISSVPTHAPANAAKIFDRLFHMNHETVVDDELKNALDEIGDILESKGISLLNIMKEVKAKGY